LFSFYFQLFLLAAAAAAAPAADQAPSPYGPPQKQYNPVVYNEKEEILPPQPFEYKYGVNDDYSQTSFDKVESQDELGRVTGSYKVSKTVGIDRYDHTDTDTDYPVCIHIKPISIIAKLSPSQAELSCIFYFSHPPGKVLKLEIKLLKTKPNQTSSMEDNLNGR